MSNRKYGYISNFKYIFSKQWNFQKGYIFSLLGDVPISVGASVIVAFLPKVVLDYIAKSVSAEKLLLVVGFISLVLIILNTLEKILSSYEEKCFDVSRLDLYRKTLFKKIIDMDYNNYIYNETRVVKEKANRAIRGYEYGVVPYLKLNKSLFASIFGFSAFAAIIAQCNVWFIPILVVCYALRDRKSVV